MDKQSQKTGSDSVAIQAAGGVTVNNGMSPDQMIAIMDAVATQVQKFSEDARQTVDRRLEEFKETVLEHFGAGGKGRAEAFGDPDFQHSLLGAQTSYARTDDEDLHAVLVDLVVQRSKQEKWDRLTLTLNDAIGKAASLTREEFNVLSLAFVFQRMQVNGLSHLGDVGQFYANYLAPITSPLPVSDGVYDYLESHGCIIVAPNIVQQSSCFEILKKRYPTLLTKGVKAEELDSLNANPINIPQMRRRSLFDPERQVLFPGSPELLGKILNVPGEIPDAAEKYTELAKANLPSDVELQLKLAEEYPIFAQLPSVYDGQPVRNSRLTSVGVALAHAHLSKVVELNAELSIWIN